MASDKVLSITNDNFESEVLNSDVPVLVDFWAPWCGPCKMIAPVIDQLADDFDGQAKIGKINVDEQSELAAKYKVMSIPTLVLFKDGNIAEQIVGARPKEALAELINNNM